ncbi:MAG: bifunctional precorrin-2 dehydrogenase/sirohydrochlorin ferrochelatase [Armatimonadetes bacterium]|nr:bifunctional precorrin-2 dehydrogenase/sirohydrochlorin ferrochelatase [Armatimonadota bacterium]
MIENELQTSSPFLYPVALSVLGRSCVVVGGGAVGARKASALVDAGASVFIVSPELSAEARELVSLGVRHVAKPFEPAFLDGAFLVIAATDVETVNAAIARAARERNVLCNLAAPGDDGHTATGDFATMATVRRGDLIFAVTTGGAGPALSAYLRRELSARYGAEWGDTVLLLGTVRDAAKAALPGDAERTAALRSLAGKAETIAALIKSGDLNAARQEAWACLTL